MPARLGGLGIVSPVQTAICQYELSSAVSAPLARLLVQQDRQYSAVIFYAQCEARSEIKRTQNRVLQEGVDQLQESLPEELRQAIKLAQEKGASNWLTALPIAKYDFVFHKSAFRDALALRYG